MEHSRVPVSYKHPGAQGSFFCSEVVHEESEQQGDLSQNRQLDCSSISEQQGRFPLPSVTPLDTGDMEVVRDQTPLSSSSTCSREEQCDCERGISQNERPQRLEDRFDCYSAPNQGVPNKSLCGSPDTSRPDPGAIHVDAFTMNWTNLIAYAFPPFNLIPAVLHKTKKETATLILIAPLGSAQPWWPLLIDYPVYLGNNSNLLTDVSHPKTTHPLFPALKLAVWRISGDISKQQVFLQQLSTCSPKALRPQPPRHITVPGLSGAAGVKNGRVIQCLLQSPKS